MLKDHMKLLARISKQTEDLYNVVAEPMYATKPGSLGFPSEIAQSSYYPGDVRITREEIERVSRLMEAESLFSENTRIEKLDEASFNVLQASVEVDDHGPWQISKQGSNVSGTVRIVRGDHSVHLQKVCEELKKARQYAANKLQEDFIDRYLTSFRTGDVEAFRESQRLWVKDQKPAVEVQFGFVEPYRDPYGVRAEFEGIVAMVDAEQTKVLTRIVEQSSKYIRKLPWAENATENGGKGLFEKELFEPPDFTSLQGKNVPQLKIHPTGMIGGC